MSDEDQKQPLQPELVSQHASLFPELNTNLTPELPKKAKPENPLKDEASYFHPLGTGYSNEENAQPASTNMTYSGQSVGLEQPSILKTKKSFRLPALAIPISLAIIGIGVGGSIIFRHQKTTDKNSQLVAPVSNPVVSTITVYYPKNLPSGFTYNNDAKTLKKNVYYFSVTGPKNQVYYITQQEIPTNFDFTAFNKKFLNPDTFSTTAGTAIVGTAGANVLASVRSPKNTWIIINTSSAAPLADMETVVQSLDSSK